MRMNIGGTIRTFRLHKGLSQGDIEKRTGLLRSYQSRVENGRTTPSLDTLTKLATGMEIPLAQFFTDSLEPGKKQPIKPFSEQERRFLIQVRR